MLKNINRYLKNISKHLKNLKKLFKKSKKYQYDPDYLVNEEDYITNNDINAFQEARMLLNGHRSNLFGKETKRIRKKLYEKEANYIFLKEKEQEGSLTNKQRKVLNNTGRYLKNFKNI